MFCFLSNWQCIFQGGGTILHSYWQHMRDLVSPNTCQHFMWSLLFILAILTLHSPKIIFCFSFLMCPCHQKVLHTASQKPHISFPEILLMLFCWKISNIPILTCSNMFRPQSLIQRPQFPKKSVPVCWVEIIYLSWIFHLCFFYDTSMFCCSYLWTFFPFILDNF